MQCAPMNPEPPVTSTNSLLMPTLTIASVNPVELSGSTAQYLLSNQAGLILADFTIPQHTGERQAQRLAGIAAGDPRRLLPTHRVGERIAVGSEHDFVRIGFQPLAQPDCHGSGWE